VARLMDGVQRVINRRSDQIGDIDSGCVTEGVPHGEPK
jgi:hypothetical protein